MTDLTDVSKPTQGEPGLQGVTAAAGFRAAGVTAGLKTSGKPDVALVVNDGPDAAVAAVFTSNRAQAHPVIWSRQVVGDGVARAVVLNSGGANCFTGPFGFQTTHLTAEAVGDALGIGAGDVVVCSTGLIGVGDQTFRDNVLRGVDLASTALSADGGPDAATAIMTTDTRAKQSVVTEDGWTVGGMAKGAGMLAPGLATMLVVITTDAVQTRTNSTRPSARPPASPSTASTRTAACRRTTPSCCCRRVRAG